MGKSVFALIVDKDKAAPNCIRATTPVGLLGVTELSWVEATPRALLETMAFIIHSSGISWYLDH
jgi:hypothetical protein